MIKSINEVSISSDIYSDITNIRSLANLFLSGKEGINSDYNKFANSIKKFLQEFNAIFQKSNNCQPSDCKEVVNRAIELRNEVIYLEELSKTSKYLEPSKMAEIIEKEKKSINRFLDDQAKNLEEITEKEEAVPLKIDYMEYIKKAYCDYSSSECQLITQKKEKTESNFKNEMVKASEYSSKAGILISGLKNDEEGFFKLLGSYSRSKDAKNNYDKALELYNSNGISNKTLERLPEQYAKNYMELSSKKINAQDISSRIFRELLIVIIKIIIPLLIIMILFIIGFKNWERDFTDSRLTKILRKD
ncbi:MAG: hypothetical protein FIB07_12510 [Candidatus Methanoperedens sp.]|nr:hypothetical protein [Candidatus Methanoperedens sp.]